jgi:hypothetical protein
MIGIVRLSIHVEPDVEVVPVEILPSASLSTETNATAPVSAIFNLPVATGESWAGIIVVRQ